MTSKTVRIFDEVARTYLGPRRYSEPVFVFLNRSADPQFAEVRRVMEDWFNKFPQNGKDHLRSRLRSSNDHEYMSALFELYLHALLVALGFEPEYHPAVSPDTEMRPDFLVRKETMELFLVEARVIGLSKEEEATRKQENLLFDAIADMESPNFLILLELNATSRTSPPIGSIIRFLLKELTNIDPDDIADKARNLGDDGLPSWRFKKDGWDLVFRPFPKKLEERGRPGRNLGGISYGARFTGSHKKIRRAIDSKATKYGEPNLPFVIAVTDYLDIPPDDIDVANGLFGQERMVLVKKDDRVVDYYPERATDGTWYGPIGAQNTRVSATLIARWLRPWNFARITPVLWHNPWARKPLDPNIWPLPQMVPNRETGQMEKREGLTVVEVLGLERNWPNEQ